MCSPREWMKKASQYARKMHKKTEPFNAVQRDTLGDLYALGKSYIDAVDYLYASIEAHKAARSIL